MTENILEVISSFGFQPIQSGTLYKIKCPFHTDYDPSLVIYTTTNSFFCFGCGESGNHIAFVAKHLNISWGEAAKMFSGIDNLKSRIKNLKPVEHATDYIRVALQVCSKYSFEFINKDRTNPDIKNLIHALQYLDKSLAENPPKTFSECDKLVETVKHYATQTPAFTDLINKVGISQ